VRRLRRRPPWRAQSLAFYLGLPGNSGYKSGISGLGVPETPDERPEIPDIVSGESGVKPGVSGGCFIFLFVLFQRKLAGCLINQGKMVKIQS